MRMKAVQLNGFEGTSSLRITDVEKPSPEPTRYCWRLKLPVSILPKSK